MRTKRIVRPTEAEVKNAIRTILGDKEHYSTSLNWAVNYCEAGLSLSGDALATQCLYILNNLAVWRHEEAQKARATLRSFSKC